MIPSLLRFPLSTLPAVGYCSIEDEGMSGLAIQESGVKCCHLCSYLVLNTEDTRRASPSSTATLHSVERRHYLEMPSREFSSGTIYPGEGGGALGLIRWPCTIHWWLYGNHSDLYTLTELAKCGTQAICWDGSHMDSTMFQGSRGRGAQSKACRKKYVGGPLSRILRVFGSLNLSEHSPLFSMRISLYRHNWLNQ